MEKARKLRGRLSRGRLSRGRLRSGGGPPGGCPWFLQAGSESQPWALLLRMVSSDLTLDSELLLPLPSFPSQEPGPGLVHTLPPETFTVGPKSFSWTPFPPVLEGLGCSYQVGDRLGSSTQSLKAHPVPEPSGTPSTEEHLSVEGPPTLQSCPMCQKEFNPRLAQLDVDNHLAQCLAESVEDVAW